MQETRQQILVYLREHGKATVKQLAEHLGLTATGVRQHLNILQEQGLAETSDTRGSLGRPALVYSLTRAGEATFPNRHDELANLLIEEIRSLAGGKGLQSVLMRVASRSAEVYADSVRRPRLADRVKHATEIINDRGSPADFERRRDDEFLIHQRSCPFPNVARANSGVCALEVEFVSQLTEGDARLVESLLRGDGCCTYRVRPHISGAAQQ